MATREKPIGQPAQERRELVEQVEELKRQNPHLARILEQFQIDQADYDRAMLQMLASEWTPYGTSATAATLTRQ